MQHIQDLWYGGCFGRGCFSRSQPKFLINHTLEAKTTQESENEHLILCRLETVYLSWHLNCLDIQMVVAQQSCHNVSDNSCDVSNGKLPLPIDALQFWRVNALIEMLDKQLSPSVSSIVQNCLAAGENDLRQCRLSLSSGSSIPPVKELKRLLCNEFLINYAVYHHYRSVRGLVVRRGIKYGCDMVLYERGPVFQHACQAVLIMEGDELNEISGTRPKINWFDASTHVRVLGNVKKQFLLCYVSIVVGQSSDISNQDDDSQWLRLIESVYANPESCLKYYRISEVELGRWTPEKTRD
jgi:tRNA splicing endonuclease